MALVALGLVHAMFRARVRGALLAAVILVLSVLGAIAFEAADNQVWSLHGLRPISVASVLPVAQSFPDRPRITPVQEQWIRERVGAPLENPLPVSVRRARNRLYLAIPRRLESNAPDLARSLRVATELAFLRSHPEALAPRSGSSDSASEYRRAQYDDAPAPWDDEPAHVWLGTFRRGPRPNQPVPPRERIELTDEQQAWVAGVSGFRDAGLIELDVRGGLVHFSLPKAVFHCERAHVWQAVYAVHKLLSSDPFGRRFRPRPIELKELITDREVRSALERRIAKQPHPTSK